MVLAHSVGCDIPEGGDELYGENMLDKFCLSYRSIGHGLNVNELTIYI